MNTKRALRGLAISAALSALVYALLAGIGDARAAASAVRSFPPDTLAAMVALSLACYLIRSVRWWWLVRLTGHRLRLGDAVYVQTAGMTMTVTPGKVGEVLKGLLARELAGLPVAKGVALVFSERLADVVAVTALSAGAVGLFGETGPALVAMALVLVASTVALNSRRVHGMALSLALKQRWFRKHHEAAAAASDTIRIALSPRQLLTSASLSSLAWGAEGIAFALCVRALGFDALGVAALVAVYAASTLIGAFTFTPGGIGLTEASLAGLLVAAGMPAGAASAATLLIRLVTLWFGVALGWAVLLSRPALLRAVRDRD